MNHVVGYEKPVQRLNELPFITDRHFTSVNSLINGPDNHLDIHFKKYDFEKLVNYRKCSQTFKMMLLTADMQ